MPLKQYKKGQTYYGYDPASGQGIAFATPDALKQHFSGFDPNAPDLPVDPSIFNSSPDKLVTGDRDLSGIAQQAGQAGVGLDEITKLLGTGLPTGTEDEIRKNLGIDELERNVFKPAPSTEQLFTDAYATAGLTDVKKRRQAITSELKTKKDELNKRMLAVNENPWLSETSRLANVANTKNFFSGDISNLTDEDLMLSELYTTALNEVNNLVSRKSTDFANQQSIDTAQINYLIAKADKEIARREKLEAGKIGRYLPEYLQAKIKSAKPDTIETNDGAVLQWDKNTGKFIEIRGAIPKDPLDRLKKELEIEKLQKEIDGGADGNELLTPTEAKTLGVPYGTTKGKAAQMGITPTAPLSAEAQKLQANVKSGLSALGTMKQELFGVDPATPTDQLNNIRSNVLGRAALPFKFAGTYTTAEREIKDILVRMRTGAAISAQEELYYQKQLPSIYDNQDTVKYKLKLFEELFSTINQKALTSPADPEGLFQEFENGPTSFKSPSSSRTDRNLNPTAFTTDVAKTAGLKEGVDYVAGDQFPGNSKLRTAKLLKDPVATTIKVLDKIGFYTSSGKPRWTHTAISQSQWNKMTTQQKAAVVEQMYQEENGANSSLKNFDA